MRGQNLNIYFQPNIYQQLQPLIRQRQVSAFVNQAVELQLDSIKNQQKTARKEWIRQACQRQNNNSAYQAEMNDWDLLTNDGVE